MTPASDYSLGIRLTRTGGFWMIVQGGFSNGRVVWQRPLRDRKEVDEVDWPDDMKARYEALLGRGEFVDQEGPDPLNIVELVAEEASGFNQACKYGYLVDDHAVYCHNTTWLYAPRKCGRTWQTGGEVRDEGCRGYTKNPRPQEALRVGT